ncbi:MAG: response regulator [Acidobacteriota bacterium]
MAESAGLKLLVVDDDEDYSSLLRDCFIGLGFDVRYAESGHKALALIQEQPPDIVLLDIVMPEMDGFEVCRRIRSLPNSANLIVIMLTARGETEDKIKGIDIGANDYVIKPFGLTELFEVVARVNRFLDTRRGYLRRMEEEKFTTLRGAANTVCHEINNPLTSIFGSARLLEKQLRDNPEMADIHSEIESILDSAKRIQTITQQLARAIRVVTTERVPGVKMIDLSASARNE